MIKKKITTGFVIQTFDTETGKFLEQEFIAGESVWEDKDGNSTEPQEEYLPFDMKQPT